MVNAGFATRHNMVVYFYCNKKWLSVFAGQFLLAGPYQLWPMLSWCCALATWSVCSMQDVVFWLCTLWSKDHCSRLVGCLAVLTVLGRMVTFMTWHSILVLCGLHCFDALLNVYSTGLFLVPWWGQAMQSVGSYEACRKIMRYLLLSWNYHAMMYAYHVLLFPVMNYGLSWVTLCLGLRKLANCYALCRYGSILQQGVTTCGIALVLVHLWSVWWFAYQVYSCSSSWSQGLQ